MAIDSAERRASVHAYSGQDWALCARLDAVSALNAADRAHVTCRYRGIAAGGLIPILAGPVYWTAGQIWLPGFFRGQIVHQED